MWTAIAVLANFPYRVGVDTEEEINGVPDVEIEWETSSLTLFVFFVDFFGGAFMFAFEYWTFARPTVQVAPWLWKFRAAAYFVLALPGQRPMQRRSRARPHLENDRVPHLPHCVVRPGRLDRALGVQCIWRVRLKHEHPALARAPHECEQQPGQLQPHPPPAPPKPPTAPSRYASA